MPSVSEASLTSFRDDLPEEPPRLTARGDLKKRLGVIKKEARGGEILGFWLFGSEGESAKNREGGKIYSKVVKKIRE